MKDPLGMLKSFTSVCCCIMCMMTCACEGCFLYKNKNPNGTAIALKLQMECKSSIARMSRRERKEYLIDKFRTFQVSVTKNKKYKFAICIGEGDNMYLVCRKGFGLAYTVSHWYIDDIIQRLRNGDINC